MSLKLTSGVNCLQVLKICFCQKLHSSDICDKENLFLLMQRSYLGIVETSFSQHEVCHNYESYLKGP